jgi:monovalent cation/proton antiporter MnhG/PhaG subunit
MSAPDETLRLILAAICAAGGLVFVLSGAVGALRGADVFARIHGVRLAGFGAPLVAAGLALEAWDAGVALRLALVAGFMAAAGPALAHLLAHAAHRAGVEPGRRR